MRYSAEKTQSSFRKGRHAMTQEFIYVIRPKRANFIETITAEEQAIIDQHFQYLQDLTEQKVMVLVGRCEDASFGIAVFRAESLEQAKRITEEDPAIKYGIMDVELKPFRIALRSKD
jgi:uncharacterized protein YciI